MIKVTRGTVVTDWESIKPHLWSKLSLFKTSLQMLEVQLQLSPLYSSVPYLRPFQWGTVWPNISRGIKNTTSQSWKIFFYSVKLDFFNVNLMYFWYPLRYRVTQYLIGKVSDMVKMSKEGSVVITLLTSVRMSWKVTIYFINGALLILNQ